MITGCRSTLSAATGSRQFATVTVCTDQGSASNDATGQVLSWHRCARRSHLSSFEVVLVAGRQSPMFTFRDNSPLQEAENRLGFGQGRRCVLPGAHRGEAAATSRKTTAAQLPEWSSCHGGWSARRTLHYLPAAVIRTQGRAGRALRARRVAAHRGHGSGRGPDLMATLIGSVSYDGLARTNSPHSGRPARSADDSSTFADLPGSATSPTTAPDPYWRSEGPNTNHTLVCGEPITALTMLDFGGHT